jgi:NADH-quinone oxidoreductase subunit F
MSASNTKIVVGLGSCGIAAGAQEVLDIFKDELEGEKVDIDITSCVGMCYAEPIVEVHREKELIRYGGVDTDFARELAAMITGGDLPVEHRIDDDPENRTYQKRQVKIVLRNCGVSIPRVSTSTSPSGDTRPSPRRYSP